MQVQRQRLTAAEVAAMLNVSLPRLYALAARGFVPGRKIGRAWYFFRPEIERWLTFGPGAKEGAAGEA